MIEVLGIRSALARMAGIQARVGAASPAVTEVGGELVAQAMRSLAPVRTGELVASVETDTDTDADESVTTVGATAEHDRFVQGGTRHMAAQPYGERAAALAAPAIVAEASVAYRAATT